MNEEPKSKRNEEVSAALMQAYTKASRLKLTAREKLALMVPFEDEVVEILPTGALYIPHIFLSERLNKIFGPGSWAWICREHFYNDANSMLCAEYVLVIKGCYVGEFYGELPFEDKKHIYQDRVATISAKGLRGVLAKNLSCGSKLWQSAYCEAWKKKNAEEYEGEYFDEDEQKTMKGKFWRKKGQTTTILGTGEQPTSKRSKPTATEDNRYIMIQLLSLVGHKPAIGYAISEGILKEGQTLEDWPLDQVPIEQDDLKALQGRVMAWAHTTNYGQKKWYDFRMPFGSRKGFKLGNIPKKTLVEMFAVKDDLKETHPEYVSALQQGEREAFALPADWKTLKNAPR